MGHTLHNPSAGICVWCSVPPVEMNHGGSTRWAQIGTTEALKAQGLAGPVRKN